MEHADNAARLRRQMKTLQEQLNVAEVSEPCDRSLFITPEVIAVFEALYIKAQAKQWGDLTNKGPVMAPLDIVIRSSAEYEVLCEYRFVKEQTRLEERQARMRQTKKKFNTLRLKK